MTTVLNSDRQHIPKSLKQHEHWVLWGVDGQGRKRPLAPWIRGDLYPVKWGSDAPERPETDWDTAYTHYRHRGAYSTPDGIDRDAVLPAPLLLHDPLDPPLMQVDFDDVRDPETGEVSKEVMDIIDKLDAFTEISQSGTGLHCFIRAELPGNLGKFIGDLHTEGQIELYDHGRCVGATWDWVPESPKTVPERQDAVDELVQMYEDNDQRKRRLGQSQSVNTSTSGFDDQNTPTSDTSDYFDVDCLKVADQGIHYASKRGKAQSPGHDQRGPHPKHGSTSHGWTESSNFVVDGQMWTCWAHDCGGGPIHLAAIMSGAVNCGAWGGSPNGSVTNDPEIMLQTCLWLRDDAQLVAEDADPPYQALVGAAKHADLRMQDPDQGILGENAARLARKVFDNLSLSDL